MTVNFDSVKNLIHKVINHKRFYFISLLILGIMVRVIGFGKLPGGVNQDEAFSGYEAFLLANYGKDSWGYSFPVYLKAWGSGMNALQTYLAIPFVKLFGLSVYTIRLPMLITSCFSLYAFYAILKELFNEKVGLLGLFILAICPWHIGSSRWALESNLAPSFTLFGLLFFVKGLKNNKYLMLSALFYGVSLYSYAITWIIVPFILIGLVLYSLYKKKINSIKYGLISTFILFVLAMPLILFLLVNNGLINEIRTSFISIPKLSSMRDSEISIRNLFKIETYTRFLLVVLFQSDGLLWNGVDGFGTVYYISIPFIIYGIIISFKKMIVKFREKEFSWEFILLYVLIVCVVCGNCISGVNINKINCIWLPLIMFLVVGLVSFFEVCKTYKSSIILLYFLFFICFLISYTGSYSENLKVNFKYGLGEAISFVENRDNSKVICIEDNIYYSQVLFYSKISLKEYQNSVEYDNLSDSFVKVKGFSNYYFGIDYDNLNKDYIYVVSVSNKEYFESIGFKIRTFDNYVVAEYDE